MKTFVLESELSIGLSPEEVFPFFADAHNLEKITPKFLQFRVLTPRPIEMKVGTLIDYRLKIRGLPIRWQSEITAWEPPYRFVDEQRRGPYRRWRHEHVFEEDRGRTLCRDRVEYATWGGNLVNSLFVRRDVEKIFAYRREVLDQLLGA